MNQALLAFETPLAEPDLAFEIGRDFARYALPPPVAPIDDFRLRLGWEAGHATFGTRAQPATRSVRRWLQLRVSAWRRGIAFDDVQVTPNHLRQIDVDWCPITRVALRDETGAPDDASIDRVRDDAGCAAGNLAVMSARANAAKGCLGFDDLLARARAAEPPIATDAPLHSLDAAQWMRLAVLCSFVTPLPHAQAADLPLCVLPPNRLRLLNPVQALQALATRQFGAEGWSSRIARLEALIPGTAARRDFRHFVHALWPRVHEAGRPASEQATRWALEDAWRCPRVLRRWSDFASRLTPDEIEHVVARAGELRIGSQRVQRFTLEEATQGWELSAAGRSAALSAPAPARSVLRASDRYPRIRPLPPAYPTVTQAPARV